MSVNNENTKESKRRKKEIIQSKPCVFPKSLTQILKKIDNIKNSSKLITCEFDEHFLQIPGLLSVLTSKLEAGLRTSTVDNSLKATMDNLQSDLYNQFPPLIRPLNVGLCGLNGSVPLSHCFTWTRYIPYLETPSFSSNHNDTNHKIRFSVLHEREVVLLLNQDQIKELSMKNDMLQAFGSKLSALKRPITCVLFSGTHFNSKKTKPASANACLSLTALCTELQLKWNVASTRICSNIADVASVIYSYHRSIAERPYKEGRLNQVDDLNFLPSTTNSSKPFCSSMYSRLLDAQIDSSSSNPNRHIPLVTQTTTSSTTHMLQHPQQVWFQQLNQWRGLTDDFANAILTHYPTAGQFYDACRRAKMAGDAEIINQFVHNLSNLEIRRGVGVLATNRRLGNEFARRLYTLFTSEDPDEIIH